MGQPVTITLYVSAADLYQVDPQPSINQQNELDAYCILGDNNDIKRGKPGAGGNLNSFTSQIYSGKRVTWIGKNIKNDGYKVSIDFIFNDNGFFQDPTLSGNRGKVSGIPQDDIARKVDNYNLQFSIDPPNQNDRTKSKTYQLDPKLGGNDGGPG